MKEPENDEQPSNLHSVAPYDDDAETGNTPGNTSNPSQPYGREEVFHLKDSQNYFLA